MLLTLNYNEVQGNAVKAIIDGKSVTCFMRVIVNEENIEEAIKKFKGNKWVVSLEYVGDITFLNGKDLTGVTVIVKQEIEKVGMDIDFTLKSIQSDVRVVFKLPKEYNDMMSIYNYSQKYPNIRFCGGNLIRLEGCHIGCIGVSDIKKKIAESRIPLVCEGCACVYKNVTLSDLEAVEFYNDKSASSSEARTKAGSKVAGHKPQKKQLSSLLDLTKVGRLDNF